MTFFLIKYERIVVTLEIGVKDRAWSMRTGFRPWYNELSTINVIPVTK